MSDARQKDDLPQLPTWKEFRERRQNENILDYVQAKHDADTRQERDRDHWFMQVFHQMIQDGDLLRNDLLGDGTLMRRGILPEIVEKQQTQTRQLEELPNLIGKAIRTSQETRELHAYRGLRKWFIGTISALVLTILTLLVTSPFHIPGVH